MSQKSFKKTCCALSLVIALPIIGGCATNYLLSNPSEQAIGEGLAVSQVRQCVRDAALARDWRIVSDQSGLMQLAYPGNPAKARHFEALVQVRYDNDSYKVSYVSSRGLGDNANCVLADKSDDPNARCIHRNVNRWMNNLNADIYREVMKLNR